MHDCIPLGLFQAIVIILPDFIVLNHSALPDFKADRIESNSTIILPCNKLKS